LDRRACFFYQHGSALGRARPLLTLGLPVWTNNQVQFVLTGESGVAYVIESSADLQNWPGSD